MTSNDDVAPAAIARLERWWLAPPILAGAVIACGLGPLFAPGEPAGADSMLHVNDAWCFARSARAHDAGMWCDGGSLGYPLAVAYQPLPAMFIALVHLVLGIALVTSAKIAMALPLVLQPLAFACGARLGGLDRARAAVFGVACGGVLDIVNYGLGPRVLLNTGLLPQAWAHVIAPIAVGAALVFFSNGRFGGLATCAITALALCHPLIAVEAFAVGVVVLVLRRRAGLIPSATLPRRALALSATSGAALAFYIVTLVTSGANNAGLVILPGAARTDLPLLLGTGALLDHQRPLPLLTIFVVIGAVLAVAPFLRVDASRPFRALAIGLVASLAWSAVAADLEWLASPLRMTTRIAPLAQTLACWLAVEAAVDVVVRAGISKKTFFGLALSLVAIVIALLVLFALPVATTAHQLARNAFARRPVVRGVFEEVLADVRALPPGNIAVRGSETRGWRHLLLVEGEHPVVWVTMGSPASASSMTFRITMDEALDDPWRYGVVGVIEDDATTDARERWRVRRTEVPSNELVLSAESRESDDVIAITDVRVEPSRIHARVETRDAGAWLLVRRSHHPWWVAHVDGAPTEVQALPPSMVGVRVPAGAHDVVIAFTRPWWWWSLVVLSAIALLAFPACRAVGGRVRRAQARRA